MTPPQRFYVFFEAEDDYPLQAYPVVIEPQVSTHVILKRNTFNQYHTPYSECVVLEDGRTLVEPIQNSSLFDQVVQTGYAYSRKACFSVCNYLYALSECFDCQMSEIHEYKEDWIISSNYCLPLCPLECRKSYFRTSLSKNKIPIDYYAKYHSTFNVSSHIINQMNISAYQFNTFAEIYATYDTFSNIEVTEEPKMSGEDMLAEIGSHLHLFLGMSLLSFVEIIEFILSMP